MRDFVSTEIYVMIIEDTGRNKLILPLYALELFEHLNL